ncbi:rhodanese-like domain-containing protein [Nitratidesulfovibrio sp. SRB-5]|uniref:rhodanese-like domain-containing protein n=1 Tax=Nitratidesulfovibrio sp. SRB-5 TaxID=2872636 RepID=UPI0010269264|nr:rhodanese-like domain-containing protein [Nitratidesulfovibrio sp. SRB-5]MBZ2171154.1 rhodanese-like domain-containing protein [Nitratidesulfovibrio sp. SRB-5]RXF77922.1 rhodanese-like domain-containing protein [Desulfovibrio sp. DS-1]
MGDGTREFPVGLQRQAEAGGYGLLAPDEAWRRVRAGALSMVDVRDAAQYEVGHVPGALCFPLPPTWMARLLRRWWLHKVLCAARCPSVAFVCDGATSTRSDSAARAAVVQGFAVAYRIAGGMDAWHAAGLPVEFGPCGPCAPSVDAVGDVSGRGGQGAPPRTTCSGGG